jgi:hypothetical protein
MNKREAKEILLLYRGPIDDSDPQFHAALGYAKTDPELCQWLGEQTRCYDTIRAKLRAIQPPPELSEQIVRKRPIPFPRDWSRIGQLAAAILISASITAPAGIKAQDGKVYLLSGEAGHSINAELADYAAKTVTIIGKQTVRDGFAQLQVEEIRKL